MINLTTQYRFAHAFILAHSSFNKERDEKGRQGDAAGYMEDKK